MKIVRIYHGEYSDFSEYWLGFSDDLECSKETVKAVIMEAQRLSKLALARYKDQFSKILIKHGRRDLIDRSTFFVKSSYAQEFALSEDLAKDLESLEKENSWFSDWQKYLVDASGGKVKMLEPYLDFELDPYALEEFNE